MPELAGTIEAVSVGTITEIGPTRRPTRSAFIKTPQPHRVTVGPLGLHGDEHVYKDHGTPDSALLAYPKEHYAHWAELGLTLPATAAMGENLTTIGLLETDVHIGDVFAAGTSTIQITEPRSPCHKLAARYNRKDMPDVMRATGFTGFLCRVLECGDVGAGDELRLLRRDDHHTITVAEASRILNVDRDDLDAARRLYAVPALGSWARRRLARRLTSGSEHPPAAGSEPRRPSTPT